MGRSAVFWVKVVVATAILLTVLYPMTTGQPLPQIIDLTHWRSNPLAQAFIVIALVAFAGRIVSALRARYAGPARSACPLRLSTVLWVALGTALLAAGTLGAVTERSAPAADRTPSSAGPHAEHKHALR